ncbi:type VII secretion-associated serine protease mycosin [Salinispora mooreana]|uniref:type VII secretion-associated serine protease mycosin n=1 Tax=Salinispora mooreana TaxID=999545 RepID=UPI00039F0055|nr:type VII secretion-associated serine protease mycosin [Salinispora mooreana]
MVRDVTGARRDSRSAARRRVGRRWLSLTSVAVAVAVPVATLPHAGQVSTGLPSHIGQITAGGPGHSAGRALAEQIERSPDQVRDDQWQLDMLRARTAWRTSTGAGVVVAVIDSGVDASHPDLAGRVLPGLDLVESSSTADPDPVGHGTAVAGLIAGRHDDSRGVVGLAPDARILPVRVLDAENRYDDALVVANGVRWAVDNGARVINLSLGGNSASPALAAALDYAFVRDVVVVACTGNETDSSSSTVWYPAREPGVVAVSGLDRESEKLWPGAITGRETVLTAPAAGLVGARPPDGYWRVQGTSFGTPLVSATAALIRARYPEMPAGDVINRMLRTARDIGPTGRDDSFGYGVVDPVAALTGEVEPVGLNPLDDQSSPGVVGFGPAPSAASADTDPGGLEFLPAAPAVPAVPAVPAAPAAPAAPWELWSAGAGGGSP